MAKQEKKPAKKQGAAKRALRTAALIGGGTLAAAAAGTAIAAKVVSKRDQRSVDPYCDLPYGTMPGAVQDTLVARDGTKLHIERAGMGSPIIFTHGFSLNSGTWYHQFEDFSKDHRVIAWDIRGHGKSAKSENDYSLQTMADDLAVVIEQETGDEPVWLAGHSMGGMVTVAFLASHPHLVDSGKIKGVILSDTGMGDIIGGLFRFGSASLRAALRPFFELGYARFGRSALHLERIRGRGTDLHYAWARLMGFGPSPSHRHVGFVREMLDQVDTEVWIEVLPSIIEMELRPHLNSLSIPVLVIVGTHDRITPLPVARGLSMALPHSQLEIIDGAGHCPMLEKPDEWNSAVQRFIDANT